MTAYETVKASASQLTFEEKDRLARELMDEVETTGESKFKEAWDAELDRRIEEIESGQEPGVDGEEVYARVLQKLMNRP